MCKYATFACLLLAGVVLAHAADASVNGALKVETIEFRDLVDTTRTTVALEKSARPLERLRDLRQGESNPKGRSVPIKVHLPATGGPYPVLIVSHGAGGDWDTHFAQAQHLASHGYAVLCLEHVGSNRERMTQGLKLKQNLEAMIHDADEVMTRPRDVSFAIDRATAWNTSQERLRGKFDLQRIGVLGHSFGAYTTMACCGMRPALEWLVPPVAPSKGVGRDLSDPRIRCGVALSPQGVGEPFFIPESFGTLKVPLLGITGTEDRQQNGSSAENRRDAFALWPKGGHAFVWITNAKHLDFTDSTGSDRKVMASKTRDDVQPITRAATLLFFDANLKSDKEAGRQLSSQGLRPYLTGAVDKVEVLSK
ncbi:MAG: hypothetical protein ACO23N_05455 [Opitutales bacterium]